MDAPPSDLSYWKARAEELETVVEEHRRRLRNLARFLPLEHLGLLEEARSSEVEEFTATSPLDGWFETTELVPSDVATEMRLLWERLDPGQKDEPAG